MVRQVARNIHQASAEQLLLQAIFGSRSQRRTVRGELDRRSLDLIPAQSTPSNRPESRPAHATAAA